MLKYRTFHLLLILLNGFLLAGCASFYAQQTNVAEQIENWVDQQEYDRALATIAVMSPDHPDYSSLTNSVGAIEQKRAEYIAETLAAAKSYEPQQDWVSARNTIGEALSNLPDSPELEAQFNFYNQNRISRLTKDESAVLIARARYLIDARPYQESMLYNANNRFFAQQQFNSFLQEARLVSRELYVLGQNYWQQDLRVQAKEALTLSTETAPNELSANLLATILETERERRLAARENQPVNIADQTADLERSFYERLNLNDYLGAQQVLNEMRAMEVEDTEQLQATLTEQKHLKAERLIYSGNQMYNSGYIEEAVSRWQQAQQLTPDDASIQQKLDRANVVLNNIERWGNDKAPTAIQP